MYIKEEYDFDKLLDSCWSGAIDTLKVIANHNKEDMFMVWLEDMINHVPTITEINDFLWFEDDFIFNELDIDTDNDDEE